jgi:hypothetical protein
MDTLMEPLYVIACATVAEELRPYLPAGTAVRQLRFGLHRDPPQLRAIERGLTPRRVLRTAYQTWRDLRFCV